MQKEYQQLQEEYQKMVEKEKILLENNKQLEKELKEFSDYDEEFEQLSDDSGSCNKPKERFKSDFLNNSFESFYDSWSNKQSVDCNKCQQLFSYNISYSNLNLEKKLHEEIVEFHDRIANDLIKKSENCAQLLQILEKTIENSINMKFTLSTYGSYANSLNMPWSDIDLLIEFAEHEDTEILLEQMETGFTKSEIFIETKYIKNATIPVLKLTSNNDYGNTKIDITVKGNKHSGLNCVMAVRQYLIYYRPLKPIMLVLKQLLYVSDLNDPYQGGLNSYGLILMVIAFIQNLIQKNIYNEYEGNYGKLLIEFLKFYNAGFDYKNNKIAPSYSDTIQNIFPFVS